MSTDDVDVWGAEDCRTDEAGEEEGYDAGSGKQGRTGVEGRGLVP